MKWSSIWSNLPRDQKKWDMNSEPQSEVMWDGMPCFKNMWVRNSWASSGESMESWVGMKRDCLVRQSTITNIAMCPSDAGSCSIKSIEMDSHGHGGIGSCLRKPYSLCQCKHLNSELGDQTALHLSVSKGVIQRKRVPSSFF